MQHKTRIVIIVALVVVALGALAGVGFAGVGGDDDAPITGAALEQASAAALAHLGGGEITETEVGDEEAYYEVEVTRADGTQVDVQLNEDFDVVGSEDDGDEDEGDEDEGDEDEGGSDD